MTIDTSYRYDEVGELVESLDGSRGRTTYRYDRIGQLLAMVLEKARAELFKYDPAGNLAEADEGAPLRVYGPGNRLLRKGDTEYRWDGDGRLREKRTRRADGTEEVWRYWWDGAGLLKMVERSDGLRVEMVYDPFARRLSKTVTRSGATRFERIAVSATKFVWDGDVPVHEIEQRAQPGGDGIVAAKTYGFEDGGFSPVAHREGDGWFHYVNDPIGTPERLVGDGGAVACELKRTAWGETEVSGNIGTPLRFQGQYEDDETGLTYNCQRYYDPRFVSPDPIGIDATLNVWVYAPNTYTWTDPYGEAPERGDLGGSGKPRMHFPKRSSRKCAKDAAGRGAEKHSAHSKRVPGGQTDHFHPEGAHDADPEGRQDRNVHHGWGPGQNRLRPGEKKPSRGA